MNLIYAILFFLNLSFSQNVNIDDYKKMIEQALSTQQTERGGKMAELRIERVKGKVEISAMGEESVSLQDNYQYPVEVGDVIKVGYDGEVNIYIDNIGIIKLLRNTELEVSEAEGDHILLLAYGTIVSKIEKIKKYTFKVKTPSALCSVKGTQFAVEHNKLSGESVFGVIDEGEIVVYPGEQESENNLYRVSKNQEIVINPSSKRWRVSNLSRLSIHRARLYAMKKTLLDHKKKWRRFTQSQIIKYRQKLFTKVKTDNKNFKKTDNKNLRNK